MIQQRVSVAPLVGTAIALVAPRAAAVDQWTAGDVWLSQTYQQNQTAGSS